MGTDNGINRRVSSKYTIAKVKSKKMRRIAELRGAPLRHAPRSTQSQGGNKAFKKRIKRAMIAKKIADENEAKFVADGESNVVDGDIKMQ